MEGAGKRGEGEGNSTKTKCNSRESELLKQREEKVRAVRVRQKVSDRSGNEANKERKTTGQFA